MPTEAQNLDAATAAADAVDPNSPQSQEFLQQTQAPRPKGTSYAERLAEFRNASPIKTTEDEQFVKGLEKAVIAKTGTNLEGKVVGDQTKAAEADAAKPASAPVERKLTDPPISGKARPHFKKLEAERDQLRARLQELEGKGATQTASSTQSAAAPAPSSDVLAMQKELEGLRAELYALDATRDPAWQQRFQQPREVTVRQAKNMAGDKGAAVENILSMPPGSLRDQKLDELLKELPASTAAIVNAANSKLAAIAFDEQVERENRRLSAGEQIKQRETESQRQATLRGAEFDRLVSEWANTVDFFNPSKSTTAAQNIQLARQFYEGKMSPRDSAAVALQATMVNSILAENNEQAQEIERLQAQLARFTGSLPVDDAAGSDEPTRPMTDQEQDRKFLAGLEKAQQGRFSDFRRPQRY